MSVGTHRSTSALLTRFMTIALSLAALLAPGVARAQRGQEIPPVSASDLTRMMAMLAMDPQQQLAATTIFDGYMAAFLPKARAVQELREASQRAHNIKSPDAKALGREHIQAWSELVIIRADAEKALLADIKALLTPDQLADKWPPVERLRRRESLSNANAATAARWYRVDLCKIISAAKLSDPDLATIRPIMDEYELEIDRPLAERVAMWDQEMHWPQDRREREDDALTRRDLDIGARIVSINRKYAKWVLSQLPPAAAEPIQQEIWRAAYPPVYGTPRPAQTTLDAIHALTDTSALTPDQTDRLAPIIAAYQRESLELEKRGREVHDTGDEEVERWALLPREQRDKVAKAGIDPFNGVYEQVAIDRRSLEEKTLQEVRAVLTAEQRERLDESKR